MEQARTPNYSTKLFTDIYGTIEEFLNDYNSIGIRQTISEENIKLTYYLLYARYGNNPISNRDINQFKFRLFATVFEYGPTWEKRLEIQEKLRGMSEEELRQSAKHISNHAYNDASENPTTSDTEELPYINDQNTTSIRRSKLEAYSRLWDLLRTDITDSYIRRFNKLFKTFIRHESPSLYNDEYC